MIAVNIMPPSTAVVPDRPFAVATVDLGKRSAGKVISVADID